jgi:hypothetical protein
MNTAIDAVPAGALVSVKLVVLALPENVSVMKGMDWVKLPI